jgi:hypothetical protein
MESRNKIAAWSRSAGAALLSLLLACTLLTPARAKGLESSLPNLEAFIGTVSGGDPDALRGVYVPNVMAYPIVPQPQDNPGFVSSQQGVVTNFGMAARAGVAGLLAHNYLAGASFSQLVQGDEVILVYGNGRTERYVVSLVLQFQALEPSSLTGNFRNLDTQVTVTAEELFNQVYRGEGHVTFQTCIGSGVDLSWGRLFAIAVPVPDDPLQ